MEEDPYAQVVDDFVEAANTVDPERRATLLNRAISADAVFWSPLGRGVGREAVNDFITEVVHGHPEGPGRLIRTTSVDAPGEWARFGWRYESPTGETILSGTDVVHLTPSGNIDQIIIFAGALT